MDAKLAAWGRAVKSRRRKTGAWPWPVLWFFTDEPRIPDPRPVVARLPRGLCGVVLRHDHAAERASLAADLALICRARRLLLVIAGDWRLARRHRAGWHVRDGRAQRRRGTRFITSSAHDPRSMRRARRLGCDLIFLSPLFPTRSHPGRQALGSLRWVRCATRAQQPVVALGGITGRTVASVPHSAAGMAGITEFEAVCPLLWKGYILPTSLVKQRRKWHDDAGEVGRKAEHEAVSCQDTARVRILSASSC